MNDAVYDPVSPESHENPYPAYERLRDDFPLYHVEAHDVWALSRYADVKQGLRDWELFSSAQGVELGTYVQFFGPGSIQELDPPHHDVLRKVLAPRFLNRRIKEYEGMVRVSARELINSFRGETEVDLGREFTQKLPILTIFRILGIPESDIPWTMQTGLDMLNRPPGESGPSQRAHELRAKLVDYMVDQVQGRRGGEYPDDVFGDIAQAIDVGVMQVDEIQGLTLLLIAAGMETTTSLMGTIVHSLATGQVTPDELRDVHGNLPAEAIDEFLRFDSPAQWLSRVTTRETEIHGVTLPRGSRVLMIFASANRDPREFDVADHLILTRDGSRNLAFGEGVHFCLGMPLARLEARAGIAELLATVPEFDPAGPPRRYPSHVIRGYESIPVTVSA
jgi:cytochrome P450